MRGGLERAGRPEGAFRCVNSGMRFSSNVQNDATVLLNQQLLSRSLIFGCAHQTSREHRCGFPVILARIQEQLEFEAERLVHGVKIFCWKMRFYQLSDLGSALCHVDAFQSKYGSRDSM